LNLRKKDTYTDPEKAILRSHRVEQEMSKRPTWKCDFKGCDEVAEWYRVQEGEIAKLCTHHNAEAGRRHWGKPIEYSDLTGEDIDYLKDKDRVTEHKCPMILCVFGY